MTTLEHIKNFPEGPFKDGYIRGYLDKLIGYSSHIALTSPNSEYTRGYKLGQSLKIVSEKEIQEIRDKYGK